MKSFASILGWLLLIAVLAVPSFLFYNWWSKGKQRASAEISREPVSASVFPSGPAKPAAELPEAAAPVNTAGAPAQQPPPAGEQPPSASSLPPSLSSAAAREQQLSTAAAQGEAPAGGAEAETSTAPKQASYYEPKSTRDPTLSPDDYRRLREEEMQRVEAEQMQRAATQVRKPREPAPETRINLQGVVGNAAIVNGDMYSVGQTVRGIKILKIGTDYIIGEYKGKKFKKILK